MKIIFEERQKGNLRVVHEGESDAPMFKPISDSKLEYDAYKLNGKLYIPVSITPEVLTMRELNVCPMDLQSDSDG